MLPDLFPFALSLSRLSANGDRDQTVRNATGGRRC